MLALLPEPLGPRDSAIQEFNRRATSTLSQLKVILMKLTSLPAPPLRQALAALLASGIVFLTGCDLSTAGPSASTFGSSATISGVVHGGQQPVYNANVRLYSAGTTGYGSASTLLATTTSDINGNFQFTKNPTNGPSSGSGPTWACPTGTANPQIYITAIGGNTQGTGVTATNNAASALMAAIGPCASVSTSMQVGLNEISTVASVFALAQYINPGTTPGTESIGTNAPNLTTSPAQSAVGLNNAVSAIANLANITNGLPVTSNTYTGSGTGVSGITITATPESAKLITIANILAACINTATASSTQCTSLFTAAAPPITPSITSQPGATFATAQDTIQAAYYMAVNPTDNTTAGAVTLPATAGTNINNLYNLASSAPPFQPGLSAQPSDWTIGVAYTASGTCTGGTAFFNGPAYAAVDAKGNLWFINGAPGTAATASTYLTFAGLSPIGQPLFCQTAANSSGRGITIDPTGNVWAGFNGGATTSIYELPNGATSTVLWSGPGSDSPYAIISDGNGNIYSTSKAGNGATLDGAVYLFPTPGTNTTPFLPTLVASGFNSSTGNSLTYSVIDGAGRLWLGDTTATTPTIHEIAPPSAAITAFQISAGVVTFSTTATNLSVNETVNITGLTSTAGLTLDHQTLTVTAVTSGTSFTANTAAANTALTTDSGIATVTNTTTGYTANSYALATTSTNSYGLAIDSNNYVYVGDGCCGSTGASERTLFKVTPAAGATDSITDSQSAQSIAAINGVRSLTLDGAANVWVSSWYAQQGDGNTGTPYGVSELYTSGGGTAATFTPISSAGAKPTTCSSSVVGVDVAGCPYNGGYQKASFLASVDMEVDPSGNVWVLDTGSESTPGSGTFNYNGASITEIVGAAVPVVTPISVAAAAGAQATKP